MNRTNLKDLKRAKEKQHGLWQCLRPCHGSEHLLEYLATSLRNVSSFPLSCRCTLPENPNNHTLQYWKDHNIVTAEVHWANLTVSVSLGAARQLSLLTTGLTGSFQVEVGSPSVNSGVDRNKAFWFCFFRTQFLTDFPFPSEFSCTQRERKMTSYLFPTHVLPSDPTMRMCGNEIREDQGTDPGFVGARRTFKFGSPL